MAKKWMLFQILFLSSLALIGHSFVSTDEARADNRHSPGHQSTNIPISVWYWQNPRPTVSNLIAVSQVDAMTATTVGAGGTILRTTDGGATWDIQSSGTPAHLRGVSFLDAFTGTAAGDNGVILKTDDGGITWVAQSSGTSENLWDVHFVDALTGLVGGENGALLRTTDGGNTWLPTQSQLKNITGVYLMNELTGVAAAVRPPSSSLYTPERGIIYRTTDGGITWAVKSGVQNYSRFFDVCFGDTNTGTVVGEWWGMDFVQTTIDGGNSWQSPSVLAPISGELLGVCYSNSLTATAVGSNGQIIRTTDGGDTWVQRASGVTQKMRDVSYTNSPVGTAVGDLGTVLRTEDGGDSWTVQSSSVFDDQLWGVSITDALTVTAVGDDGVIYRTSDGGTSWAVQASGTSTRLRAVSFLDALTGVAVGNTGVLLTTDDGGSTWLKKPKMTSQGLTDVHFTNDTTVTNKATVTGVGQFGVVIRSNDGGATWSRLRHDPLYIYPHLNGVWFTDYWAGTAVGGDGEILWTKNAGIDWHAALNSGTTNTLLDVCFADSLTGVAVGVDGTIVRTTNTGFIWTSVPSGTTHHLWRVWFNDLSNGWVVGDHGTVLQTSDGGLTWSIQTLSDSHFRGVSFSGDGTGIIVGDNGSVLMTQSILVPTVVQQFNATLDARRVLLTWEIESDDDVAGFRLQRRCTDDQTVVVLPEFGLVSAASRSLEDSGVEAGRDYVYTLVVVLSNGDEIRSRDVSVSTVPIEFGLRQNYPNPFNPTTTISYSIGQQEHVTLEVFDVHGRFVRSLVDAVQNTGVKSVVWDGRNSAGESAASGIYFYRLRAGKFKATRKMLLLR